MSVIPFPSVLQVHWQILGWGAGDFLSVRGSVVLLEGLRGAELLLSLLPDHVPELEEVYTVRLTTVEGGATLDANRTSVRLR